ncbi:MAG: hypothetical protein KAT58_09080 [candidate division Zixibacteria bacterium]|nr:hypothetical protein [candidate division Zixibacteria bacterium]
MKVLRISFLVLLAAFLSLLLSGTVTANDHPWDDCQADSTETTGIQGSTSDEDSVPDEERYIIKAKNWIIKFLTDFFASGTEQEVDREDEGDSTVRVKSKVVLTKGKAKTLVPK